MVEAAEIAIFVGMFAVGVAIPLYLYAKYYVRVPPNKAYVVYGGKYGGKAGFRVITGGGLFVRPILDSYEELSLEPVQVIAEWDLLTKDGREVRVEILCNVGVARTKEKLEMAAKELLDKEEQEIRMEATKVIEGQARTLAIGFTYNQIKFNRESFADPLEKRSSDALGGSGLVVTDMQVNEVGEPFHREEILDRLRLMTERLDTLERQLKDR